MERLWVARALRGAWAFQILLLIAGVARSQTPAGDEAPALEATPETSPIASILGQEPSRESGEAKTKPKFELRGRIHADAIFANQSPTNKAILGDLENAVGFRRARIGAQGYAADNVKWVIEFDFAGGSVNFKDVFVAVTDLPILRQVRVGHFPEPFSLEGEISTNTLPFIERSPINALDPDRNWGVCVFTHTENLRATLQTGAFKSGSGSDGTDIGDGNDMAYTSRITALPWWECSGGEFMHVGAAFSQRFPKNDIVTFQQGPRSSLLTFATDDPLTPFVPDLSIRASQNQLYNLQWAMVLGPLCVQAEWYGTTIRQIGAGPVFLHGSYLYAGYFLTGENRRYNREEGYFESVRVRRPFRCHDGQGPGAWEVSARFAYLDFADPNLPRTDTGLQQGNRLAETTFGLNWHLNDNTRLMFNYLHVIPVDPNFGPSAADGFFTRIEVFW